MLPNGHLGAPEVRLYNLIYYLGNRESVGSISSFQVFFNAERCHFISLRSRSLRAQLPRDGRPGYGCLLRLGRLTVIFYSVGYTCRFEDSVVDSLTVIDSSDEILSPWKLIELSDLLSVFYGKRRKDPQNLDLQPFV